jgi:hypothetical protein
MHDLPTTRTQPDPILRWAGRAGVAGSILMVVTFGVVAAFVGMDLTPERSLTAFADLWPARMLENTLYLGVLLLWIVHALGLHRALRAAHPASALFGTALSILGLGLLAAGAIPHVATAPLAELYQHATPREQATLVLVWHGVDALFNALLYTGLVVVPAGLVMLGTAMVDAPGFGRRVGRTTVALGVAGLAAAAAVLAGVTDLAAAGVVTLVGFHAVVGRRLSGRAAAHR